MKKKKKIIFSKNFKIAQMQTYLATYVDYMW